MSFHYFSQIEEARMRQDELLRAAKAARLANAARARQPSLPRRLWQIMQLIASAAQAKPVARRHQRVGRGERPIGALPTLHVRAHESADRAQVS